MFYLQLCCCDILNGNNRTIWFTRANTQVLRHVLNSSSSTPVVIIVRIGNNSSDPGLVMYIDLSAEGLQWPEARTQTQGIQVLGYSHRSAWRRPRTQCSSGPFLPQQQEPTGSHKHFGCARRPPLLPSWASRPRLSPQTPSLHCWQSHYAATCGSRSCGSSLGAERRKGKERIREGLKSAIVSLFISLLRDVVFSQWLHSLS